MFVCVFFSLYFCAELEVRISVASVVGFRALVVREKGFREGFILGHWAWDSLT